VPSRCAAGRLDAEADANRSTLSMRIRLTSTLPSARPRSPCRSGASTTTHHEAEDDEAHQPKRSDHRASASARCRGDLRTCGRSPFPPSPFWFWSAPWWCSVIRAPCACTHCWARASLGDSNPARPAPRPIALTGQPSALAPSPERLPASARLPPQSMRSASQFLAWIFASSSRRARASSSAARCSCATSSGVTKRTSDLLYRSCRNEACCAASIRIA
jgi:hypothetical protein